MMKQSEQSTKKHSSIDIHSEKSDRKGILGWGETLFRKFKTPFFLLLLLPILFLYIFCMGVALTPGMAFISAVSSTSKSWPFILRNFSLGVSVATTYLMYGLTLIFIVPLVNKILPLKLRPLKSSWYSLEVIPWYYHNALTYLVRYTFLDFITPTPLNKLFYQMMGMKIGKGSVINTSNISDPCLIEIGDYVTVGGSASLVAHYGQKGILVIEKLIIKNKVTVGLKSSLFGGVIVEEGATIKPHEVILPKAIVPSIRKDKKEVA